VGLDSQQKHQFMHESMHIMHVLELSKQKIMHVLYSQMATWRPERRNQARSKAKAMARTDLSDGGLTVTEKRIRDWILEKVLYRLVLLLVL